MYGGDASDYYREHARKKAENRMIKLGYIESDLTEFETYELDLMADRIIELKRQKSVDLLIEKLNGRESK
jgi:hypothetical protein